MSLLNIGGDKDDMFYRYKMPPVQSKIEGKGNGIKTVIPNMNEVAKALNRPPMYPCKYFGTELGAQTKHEPKNDRYIVNGAHDAQRLQELLTGFIEKFVLCGACGNPETDLKIKDGIIERSCLACGRITPIDMRHKLTNFILNHPPPGAVSGGAGKKKGGKRKGNKSKDHTPNESADEHESGDELHKQIMEEAKNLAEARSKEDDWSVDMSEEAQKKRQAELLQGVGNLTLSEGGPGVSSAKSKKSKKKPVSEDEDEDDFAEEDPLDVLAGFVKSNPKATDTQILQEIKESRIPMHLASHVLVQVLVLPESMAGDLKKHASLFQKMNNGNARVQKYFLGGIERTIALSDSYKKAPVVLKVVYDLDLAEEEVILSWGAKATKRFTGKKKTSQQVHDAAQPFLDWLKEAEEESEEESDEE